MLEPRRLLSVVAFPGAEGFGAAATGGRGGDVYRVTNLNDTGAGSLRNGISTATGPRTIIFNVGGTIELNSRLRINKPNLTIAGQTAPGDGITIKNYDTTIESSNIILRHLRFRLGTDRNQEADSLWINGGSNIVVDHVSASWSVDETLSLTNSANNVTVQNSYITESLHNSIHSKGPHGYASLIRPTSNASYTLYQNLYAHHNSRNPRPGSYNNADVTLDFRNNVVYNWGSQAGYNGADGGNHNLNYVNNYFIAGPSTSSSKRGNAFQGAQSATFIFQSGNRIDSNVNGVVDGTNTGWSMFSGTYTQCTTPHAAPNVITLSAQDAYSSVINTSGARPWNRDAVDVRVTNTVINQTGAIVNSTAQVGGYPAIANGTQLLDSDLDGMPDIWELTQGFNPLVANNNADSNGNGYTDLEEYLNGFAVRLDRVAPALVGSPSFSFDAASQSLTFTFDEAVARSASLATLVLTNTTTGQTVPASAFSISTNHVTNTATFTFNQPLDDGQYQAVLQREALVDAAGNPLASDATASFHFFRGDMNRDGLINNLDIAPFVSGLTSPGTFESTFGYRPELLGDVNRDGAFNNLDIAPFVALLTGARLPASPFSDGGGRSSSFRTPARGDMSVLDTEADLSASRTADTIIR